jgi:hypothetical protein
LSVWFTGAARGDEGTKYNHYNINFSSIQSLARQGNVPAVEVQYKLDSRGGKLKLILDMRLRNPSLGLIELWRRLKQCGYTRRPDARLGRQRGPAIPGPLNVSHDFWVPL